MKQATSQYIHSIQRTNQDYEHAQNVCALVQMGATPLGALWVVERKVSRKFRKTIERLER